MYLKNKNNIKLFGGFDIKDSVKNFINIYFNEFEKSKDTEVDFKPEREILSRQENAEFYNDKKIKELYESRYNILNFPELIEIENMKEINKALKVYSHAPEESLIEQDKKTTKEIKELNTNLRNTYFENDISLINTQDSTIININKSFEKVKSCTIGQKITSLNLLLTKIKDVKIFKQEILIIKNKLDKEILYHDIELYNIENPIDSECKTVKCSNYIIKGNSCLTIFKNFIDFLIINCDNNNAITITATNELKNVEIDALHQIKKSSITKKGKNGFYNNKKDYILKVLDDTFHTFYKDCVMNKQNDYNFDIKKVNITNTKYDEFKIYIQDIVKMKITEACDFHKKDQATIQKIEIEIRKKVENILDTFQQIHKDFCIIYYNIIEELVKEYFNKCTDLGENLKVLKGNPERTVLLGFLNNIENQKHIYDTLLDKIKVSCEKMLLTDTNNVILQMFNASFLDINMGIIRGINATNSNTIEKKKLDEIENYYKDTHDFTKKYEQVDINNYFNKIRSSVDFDTNQFDNFINIETDLYDFNIEFNLIKEVIKNDEFYNIANTDDDILLFYNLIKDHNNSKLYEGDPIKDYFISTLREPDDTIIDVVIQDRLRKKISEKLFSYKITQYMNKLENVFNNIFSSNKYICEFYDTILFNNINNLIRSELNTYAEIQNYITESLTNNLIISPRQYNIIIKNVGISTVSTMEDLVYIYIAYQKSTDNKLFGKSDYVDNFKSFIMEIYNEFKRYGDIECNKNFIILFLGALTRYYILYNQEEQIKLNFKNLKHNKNIENIENYYHKINYKFDNIINYNFNNDIKTFFTGDLKDYAEFIITYADTGAIDSSDHKELYKITKEINNTPSKDQILFVIKLIASLIDNFKHDDQYGPISNKQKYSFKPDDYMKAIEKKEGIINVPETKDGGGIYGIMVKGDDYDKAKGKKIIEKQYTYQELFDDNLTSIRRIILTILFGNQKNNTFKKGGFKYEPNQKELAINQISDHTFIDVESKIDDSIIKTNKIPKSELLKILNKTFLDDIATDMGGDVKLIYNKEKGIIVKRYIKEIKKVNKESRKKIAQCKESQKMYNENQSPEFFKNFLSEQFPNLEKKYIDRIVAFINGSLRKDILTSFLFEFFQKKYQQRIVEI